MIVQKSLVEMVCEEIKRMIAHGELAGGDRVREIDFSERLGVSRPPLREALRILAAEHVLELSPRRGYRVVGLTGEDAEELASLRIVLEEFGLKILHQHIDQADFSPLHDTVDRMRQAAAEGDELAMRDLHREYHIALIDLSGHKRLAQSYLALLANMEMYMALSVASEAASGALAESAQRHADLLAALESRDKRAINAEFRRHNEAYQLGGLVSERYLALTY
jgi:DNA-binding GntR family transcriptional regulator